MERAGRPISPERAVLVVSHDRVGAQMAGPGIRYWELARVLARHLPVVLAAPGEIDLAADGLHLWPYTPRQWETLAPAVEGAQAILLCGDVLDWFPALRESATPLVVDGYDPHPLETLALFAGTDEQAERHWERERILQLQARAGDFFVCASERQRDWWLGLLEAAGRVNVHTHGEDPSLRRLVDVVPFGLPASPPRYGQQAIKGVWPGVGAEDRLLLWGGGLWQWLDPLTAIRAVARVRVQRPDVRLVFPGTRHPNRAAIPDMPMRRAALTLAEELELLDRHVFFGEWVPRAAWPSVLLEADVGLSLHFDTVETRLAFRSRLLDYVWAGLPMVVSGGDASSEIVARFGLGEVVGCEADEAVAAALLHLLERPRQSFSRRFERARAGLTWERAAEPLLAFCRQPRRAPDKVRGLPLPPAARASSPQRGPERDAPAAVEIARLQALVADYERGRFMRLMRWLHDLRQRRR
ncbi:MAG: glycosyltransferase family 1 protein [Anaerolineae bacterium]|nr:glycosyltransferase family 1 protein [Anaerolineae bacterium]